MTLHQYPEIEQHSEEWFAVRRGIVTASVVGKLISTGPPDAITIACPKCEAPQHSPCVSVARKDRAPIKTCHDARVARAAELPPIYDVATGEVAQGLTMTLAAERIAGWTEDLPMTSDMWRGVEAEPYAREVYRAHVAEVEEIGFMRRDEDTWRLGYSPDGLVGTDGLLEIKSPRAKTHVRTVIADEVPAHYMPQLQAGLLVTGRKWIDFVSYVGGMHLSVKRVYPDPAWFEAITAACIAFETNAARIVADYEARVAGLPTTERIDFKDLGLVI